MRVDETKQASFGGGGTPHDATPEEPHSDRQALVALDPAVTPAPIPANYRQAPFLAHLIATKDLLPQTRERRRAQPGEAIAAYRAAADLMK